MSIQETAFPVAAEQPSPFVILIHSLKASIKEDARSIRVEKDVIRSAQKSYGSGAAASNQSRLAYHRLEARARLLIYGLIRGRTLEQIESKHTMTPLLKYAIQRIWTEAQKQTEQQTGVKVPMPESVMNAL